MFLTIKGNLYLMIYDICLLGNNIEEHVNKFCVGKYFLSKTKNTNYEGKDSYI